MNHSQHQQLKRLYFVVGEDPCAVHVEEAGGVVEAEEVSHGLLLTALLLAVMPLLT
jgi:hypothetical protein